VIAGRSLVVRPRDVTPEPVPVIAQFVLSWWYQHCSVPPSKRKIVVDEYESFTATIRPVNWQTAARPPFAGIPSATRAMRWASSSPNVSLTLNSALCDPPVSVLRPAPAPARGCYRCLRGHRCRQYSGGSARRAPALPAEIGRGGPDRRVKTSGRTLSATSRFNRVSRARAIHFTHSPGANQRQDFVRPNPRQRRGTKLSGSMGL